LASGSSLSSVEGMYGGGGGASDEAEEMVDPRHDEERDWEICCRGAILEDEGMGLRYS
jgi:hypothetical protein